MLSVDEARALIGSDGPVMRIVMRPLAQLGEDVLAEDIVAREDIPLFDATAMDGYAIRSADVRDADVQHPVRLRVVGEVQPGEAPGTALRRGCALRIFTGAVIPPAADAVIMQEQVHREADTIAITGPVDPGMHIRRKGEEFRTGTPVLSRGSVVTPAVCGLLATLGYARVRVHERPSVTLLVTGNELRAPSEPLAPGQIRDANSYILRAALARMGIDVTLHHVPDDADQLRDALRASLLHSDIVITTGGVSVGDHDHVREVAHELRVREQFWRVAMKPGKPVYFGVRGRRLLFGLPGNPVSALLGLYLFVRPAIARSIGLPLPAPHILRARLGKTMEKAPGREQFVFMALENGQDDYPVALPLPAQGSHMLGSAARSDLLYRFPREARRCSAGTVVDLEWLRWGWGGERVKS